MKLTHEQVEYYRKNGYLLLEGVFDKREVDLILQEMNKVITEDCPRRILEKNGAVRSFFAPDHTNEVFYCVTRLRRLVDPARQLLEDEIYIHQTKINTKHAMIGDWWEWHRDYTFWSLDDGMPQPHVLTAMIYLSDINEFNGPMLLIPGSHAAEDADIDKSGSGAEIEDNSFKQYQASTSYMSALTANLKYTLTQEAVANWVKKRGLQSAKGPAGSVLFFHGNIFHASSNNLSPWDRHAFLITYNSMVNTLPEMINPRPAFIANREFAPIIPLQDEILQKSLFKRGSIR